MKLTKEQRIQLEIFINQQKGSVGQVRSFMRILDAIGLGDEDDVKRVDLPGGLVRFEWDRERDEPKEFELKQQDRDLLKSSLEAWSGFSAADLRWLDPILDQV